MVSYNWFQCCHIKTVDKMIAPSNNIAIASICILNFAVCCFVLKGVDLYMFDFYAV